MKNILSNNILFVLYISLINFNYGQYENNYEFIPLSNDISQTTISSIIKDDDGILWLGSSGDGVFKYNSLNFKGYKKDINNENSLNSSFVHTLLKDNNNNIWAGTQEGINIYNRDLDKFNSINFKKDGRKVKFPVHAITDLNDSTLIVGTHQNGLYKLNTKNYNFKSIPYKSNYPSSSLQINAIVKNSNGIYLVGTNHGLMSFDPYKGIFALAKFDLENKYESINLSIESILIDKNKSIWLGTTNKGVIKLSLKNEIYNIEILSITKKRVLALSLKQNGNILCGTENDGLFEIHKEKNKIINHRFNKNIQNGLKSNSIWSIYTDEKNIIWLGYFNNGIDVYNENYNKFKSLQSISGYQNSLSSSSVTGIIKDDKGRLWISTTESGIDVYNLKTREFTNLIKKKNNVANGLNKLETTTIYKDSKGNILIGTWESGFYILTKNSNRFKKINKINSKLKSNKIMSFAEDSKGIIWIGTFNSGLYSYNIKSNKITHYNSTEFKKHNIIASNIRKVLVDKKDNIWIGTRAGLYQINKSDKNTFKITSFNNKFKSILGKDISSTIIFSLFEDINNDIWMGSLDYGLFKYNYNTDKISWFNNKKGFIHESVSSITQDENKNIWISGNKGLTKFDSDKNLFDNFNKDDGLLSNKFNYNSVFRDSQILYFGGLNGINYFNPNEIKYNEELPLVYLKDLKLSNELVTINTAESPLKKALNRTDKLTLNHNQSFFSIEYVGVNYTRSENNQYAYLLEGFDEKWNYVGSETNATFTNVPAGDYIFKVKASNNDGLWNEIPTKLNIEILPAWWATKIAWFTYLLTLIFLSFISYRFFNVRIKEKRTLKFEREERKQLEDLNSRKIQFFTNISHEFRTPLTLILNPLNDIIKNDLHSLSQKTKNNLEIIHKNSNRLSRLINELMDFRKLQFNKMSVNTLKIDLISFIEEVVSHFKTEATQKNIILSVDYYENPIFFWGDPSMLEKIIFNLLSNAFKATPLNGMVSINIIKNQKKINFPLINNQDLFESIEISIEDTGSGIKEENINKIFERFYQVTEFDKQYYGGTGIGLEVVKNFIELHKGKIEVSSKLNIGTQFKIQLPSGNRHLGKSNSEEEEEEEEEVVIETNLKSKQTAFESSDNKVNKTLLIVDDNSELRSYLNNELKNEYNILLAENGQLGFELANKYIPDIIITDIMMPIMDGNELCKIIKNDLRTSHIPIMMITAKGMEIDKIKGIDSGADVYLQKPFNMDVLKSHLKQLISTRKILFKKYLSGIDFSENTTSLDQEFILNVLGYINNNISDNNLNVENLADELLLSRSKLYRKIKALTGLTANEFIRNVRLEKSKELIENSELSISEICYKVGFSSPSYFTKCFRIQYGFLPKEIRENNK
tara:strand:- start:1399 stop:5526 length:4128 start_codon:yes stop_codon:yes gene_type:complete